MLYSVALYSVALSSAPDFFGFPHVAQANSLFHGFYRRLAGGGFRQVRADDAHSRPLPHGRMLVHRDRGDEDGRRAHRRRADIGRRALGGGEGADEERRAAI